MGDFHCLALQASPIREVRKASAVVEDSTHPSPLETPVDPAAHVRSHQEIPEPYRHSIMWHAQGSLCTCEYSRTSMCKAIFCTLILSRSC